MEGNDLICGPKKRDAGKTQKNRAVSALVAAGALFVVIHILQPYAREYSWKNFVMAPFYLLQYVLRPLALALLGWGIVEAGKAFAGIRIWEGRTERTVRMIRMIFYASAVVMAVFAILVLWTAVDLTYDLWQFARMRSQGGNFDFSTIPQLMPWQLQWIYIKVMALHPFGGAGFFLGAALGFCRVKREEPGTGEEIERRD